MPHYRNARGNFLLNRAYRFFANFIRNNRGQRVNDDDAFAVVTDHVDERRFIEGLRRHIPERVLQKLSAPAAGPCRLDFAEPTTQILQTLWNAPAAQSSVAGYLLATLARLESATAHGHEREMFPKRLEEMKRTFGLSEVERDVLLVAYLLSNQTLQTPYRGGGNMRGRIVQFTARCLDRTVFEVSRALSGEGKLRRYHCVDEDGEFFSTREGFLLGIDKEPLASQFFRKDTGETLPLAFYGDLAVRHGAILKDIIEAGKGRSSVNILLYGAPGTGKTSFARTLAAELGRTCYLVAQCQESGTDRQQTVNAVSSPEFRFGALQICASRIDTARSLVIVDEADKMLDHNGPDLFGVRRAGGDKGLLNSVLDTVKVPTIWITNSDAEDLDPSSRRRFDYSIKFEPLTAAQRLCIWRNNVEKMKLGRLFTEAQLDTFAHRYGTNAGGITLTLQNIAKLRPAADRAAALVEKFMKPHCELMGVNVNDDRFAPAKDYSLDGLNVKGGLPLDRIVEAVRRYQEEDDQALDRPRMNLLLSGAPGTGKTEFVKYLGRVLDRKVSVRMGSDLLSMWVGGTEQNIKRVFREAEEEKSILFLDEIDGLVQTRERASKSWEVTQVNELLHQMEDFTGVMVGATNFAANLDPAILRRFTFKIEFGFLDTTGKRLFFERMFGTRLNDLEAARLALIPNLAPGDFRTVRQSLYYLGGDVTNAMRLEALAKEGRAKGVVPFGAGPAPVGFGA